MEAFADASYAENKADRRSVSEGVVMFAGAAFSWSSKTQACVTSSSAEGAYVSLAEGTSNVLFLKQLFESLQPHLPVMRVGISEDNEGGIKLAANPICTSRTKHMDVRHHFLRETVQMELLAHAESSDHSSSQ